ENPFQKNKSAGRILLATLLQDSPVGGKNLLQRLVASRAEAEALPVSRVYKEFFAQYMELVLRPLIMAQANYGILLGAHQQNLVLHIENGHLLKVYFRDCQGTGYSELGYSLFAKEVPALYRENGNVVSEKMGNYLF